MESFYFSKKEADDFIKNHSVDEIKQEIERAEEKAKDELKYWSFIDDAEQTVKIIRPDFTQVGTPDDPYYQVKSMFASHFVEYRKYIEYLEKYINGK